MAAGLVLPQHLPHGVHRRFLYAVVCVVLRLLHGEFNVPAVLQDAGIPAEIAVLDPRMDRAFARLGIAGAGRLIRRCQDDPMHEPQRRRDARMLRPGAPFAEFDGIVKAVVCRVDVAHVK